MEKIVDPRIIEDEELWHGVSNYIPGTILPKIITSFRTQLIDDGYRVIPYDHCPGPSRPGAIAYSKDDVPFRQEPILIDEGSIVGPNGLPLVSIVIRDAEGKNKKLHDDVLGLLARYGITSPNESNLVPCDHGGKAYGLRTD